MLSQPQLDMGTHYPARDDTAGWREHIAHHDAVISGFVRQPDSGVRRDDRRVGDVPVYAIIPDAAENDDRVQFEIHGGALIYLGGEPCAAMAAASAARRAMNTWAVDYRMPPDHPYPTPLDDCVAAYRALLAERPADRIVVSGASAGGNLAAALMLRIKREDLPMPAALVLQTPEVDLTESGDSFTTNLGLDSHLGRLTEVNLLYADGHPLDDPLLSPLFGDLRGLPPTILTTGTRDLFLSNTVRMHRALRRAGVQAELHVLEAAPHAGFLGMAPEDQELSDEIVAFIGRHCPR